MNSDSRRDEAAKRYCRLNPEDDIIARPALVVPAESTPASTMENPPVARA